MKKIIKREIDVEIEVCNICKKDIPLRRQTRSTAFERRIPMVNGLFKITTFDAHDACINKVVREAFKKFV